MYKEIRLCDKGFLTGWRIAGSFDVFDPIAEVYTEFEKDNPTVQYTGMGDIFLYLYRRFGQSNLGYDWDKEVTCYYLTTPRKDVVLRVSPSYSLESSLGFGVSMDLYKPINTELWLMMYNKEYPQSSYLYQQVKTALRASVYELLAPVMIRDYAIHILGECDAYDRIAPFMTPQGPRGGEDDDE